MDDQVIDFSSNSKHLELLPKQSQGSNNEYNNQVHLIQRKLLKMGFDISMVNNVIYYYKITSVEEGIYYLVKTDGMWNHSFIPQQNAKEQEMGEKLVLTAISTVREKTNQELCAICGELKSLHRSFNQHTPKTALSGKVGPREMDTIDILNFSQNEKESNARFGDENEIIGLDNITTTTTSAKAHNNGETDNYKDNEQDANGINCSICLSEYDNPIQLKPCNHKFCKECFTNYLTDKIYNNNLDNINCPKSKCLNQLQEGSFLHLLPDEYVLKYHAFKKKNEISKDPFKIFCPHCDSYGMINSEEKQSDKYGITCVNGHSFCCCGRSEHDGPCYKEGEETIEFIRNERIKKCPKCGFLIKKDHGCNHMTCGNPNCQYEFCWLCMRESLPDHYKYGECQGMQFIEENGFLFKLRKRPLIFLCVSKILNFFSCLMFIILLILFLLLPTVFYSLLTYVLFVSNNQIIEMFQINIRGNKKVYAVIFWLTMTITSFSFLPIYYFGLSIIVAMLPMLIVRKIVIVFIRCICSCLFRSRNDDNITSSNDNEVNANLNSSEQVQNDNSNANLN